MIEFPNIIRRLYDRSFSLKGRVAIAMFRFLILAILLLFVFYGQNALFKAGEIDARLALRILTLAIIYLATNIFLIYAPGKLLQKGLQVWLYVFDIAIISYVFYLTQGLVGDLFMIYILVIFLCSSSKKPFMTFLVAGLACALYGSLYIQSHSVGEFLQPEILIRLSVLLFVALFSTVLVHGTVTSQKEVLRAQMENYWMNSEKFIALGEMSTGIAHEINNPLTSVLGTAQLVLHDYQSNLAKDPSGNEGDPPGGKVSISIEQLRIIERNALRCSKIVSDLLKFAGEPDFQFKKVDMKSPLVDAYALLESQIKFTGITVKWSLPEETGSTIVIGSQLHLQQVFFNLLMNSIQAMPNGGVLTLAVQSNGTSGKRFVEARIEDTGVGIPKEKLGHLYLPVVGQTQLEFRSFLSTVKKGGKGRGFGLAIAHHVVCNHNGRFILESDGTGKGTQATVRLPALE